MKQKWTRALIMVLVVAAVVAGTAFLSVLVAPKPEAAEAVNAVVAPAETAKEAVTEEAVTEEAVAEEVATEETPVAEETVQAEEIEAAESPVAVEEAMQPAEEAVTAPVDEAEVFSPVKFLQSALVEADELAQALIGRWQMEQEDVAQLLGVDQLVCILEFTEDGRCVQTLSMMGYQNEKVDAYAMENGQLKINGNPVAYVLDGDMLSITTDDVEVNYFRLSDKME